MIDKDDIQRKVREDEDYIRSPKFANSLKRFLKKNPDGAKDDAIARLLSMTEEEVEEIYQEAIQELREEMEEE